MDAVERYNKRREITKVAETLKVSAVLLLVISVVAFAIMQAIDLRPFIYYWAGFMMLLVIICAILDLRNASKIRRLGL